MKYKDLPAILMLNVKQIDIDGATLDISNCPLARAFQREYKLKCTVDHLRLIVRYPTKEKHAKFYKHSFDSKNYLEGFDNWELQFKAKPKKFEHLRPQPATVFVHLCKETPL